MKIQADHEAAGIITFAYIFAGTSSGCCGGRW
jgi:hypothetical protein